MPSKLLDLAGTALVLSALLAGTPAMAQHGHGGHGGGHVGGWGLGLFGLGLGLALTMPYYPYYAAPYSPPTYYRPYPPPVIIQEPVYIQQGPAQYAPAPPPPPQYAPQAAVPDGAGWWYYCATARGYYPYVERCPGGWQRVAPTPQ